MWTSRPHKLSRKTTHKIMFKSLSITLFWLTCLPAFAAGQAVQNPQPTPAPLFDNVPVQAIKAPRAPLPSEEASANVQRFSFIVYGDTRGRRDGLEQQYEHSLIVN